MTNNPQTFELSLRKGIPDGLRLAYLSGWDGVAVLGPRTQFLDEMRQRPEVESPGVYLLRSEEGETPRVYIGKSKNPSNRIYTHYFDEKKHWCEEIVVISSLRGKGLNSAQAGYLEARMIEKAKNVNRVKLENDKGEEENLSETETDKMKTFLEGIYKVLPLVRIDDFVDEAQLPNFSPERLPKFIMGIPNTQEIAKAVYDEDSGKFIVRKGSFARSQWHGRSSGNERAKHLHKKLLDDGILKKRGNISLFTQDFPFPNISLAAKIVAGAPRSGTNDWRLDDMHNKTFKDWQQDKISSIQNDGPVDTIRVSSPSHEKRIKFIKAIPHREEVAEAFLDTDGKLIVLKGSYAQRSWMGKSDGNRKAKDLRTKLRNEGILEKIDGKNILRFTRDFKFDSDSLAAQVVAGANCSGPATWKVHGKSQTLKNWRESQCK